MVIYCRCQHKVAGDSHLSQGGSRFDSGWKAGLSMGSIPVVLIKTGHLR